MNKQDPRSLFVFRLSEIELQFPVLKLLYSADDTIMIYEISSHVGGGCNKPVGDDGCGYATRLLFLHDIITHCNCSTGHAHQPTKVDVTSK
ncbi:hypothetical protein SUGI_0196650 [Cryptomeria japonica]|nr:hypothetical protein SUGI_0196650 [Cryptomeria japonica]